MIDMVMEGGRGVGDDGRGVGDDRHGDGRW